MFNAEKDAVKIPTRHPQDADCSAACVFVCVSCAPSEAGMAWQQAACARMADLHKISRHPELGKEAAVNVALPVGAR